MDKTCVKGTWQEDYSFSPAVTTRGGRVFWLAGHTGQTADDGRSLAGDIEAQTRQTFRNLGRTLAQAGGSLGDLVTLTVFLLDALYAAGHGNPAPAPEKRFSGKRGDHGRRVRQPGHADRDPGGGGDSRSINRCRASRHDCAGVRSAERCAGRAIGCTQP